MSIAERVPVGVVGAITPWNFPLILGMRVVAPALALGNAVVLKPSPETPLTGGLVIAELLAEAGLPAGVLNVVTGDQEVGERLVAHPGTLDDPLHRLERRRQPRSPRSPASSSSASRSSSAATTRWSSSRTPTSTRRR